MTGSVYIHGTNGSGKTTLARALMICAGPNPVGGKVCDAPVTFVARATPQRDVYFIGKYTGPTGGLDTVQPFKNGVHAAIARAGMGDPVVMESMVTPGLETCQLLHKSCPGLVFFWLDTPVQQCINQTLERRARRKAARGQPPDEDAFDPVNLQRKAASVASWAARLTEAGIPVERGDWAFVYARCKAVLGITEPGASQLLDAPAVCTCIGPSHRDTCHLWEIPF